MKVCTCFLLIFAYTNSISRIRPKGDHRIGVHLPQETVMEYSNEEYSADSNSIDNVHNIKTRGTTVHDKNMKLVFRAPEVETLTDFIQKAVTVLNTYEDTAFEDFFHILDNEIRKYHYNGCKFSELTQNSDTRGLLAGSFKLIRGKPVSYTKANINELADIISDETYDKNVKELLDYINTLYRNNKLNFDSVLNELKYYRKTKSMKTHYDLVQFIRAGVRAILFDHYTKLTSNSRRELKERIETFWQHFKNNPASNEINDIPYTNPVIKSVVNSIKELNNPKPYSKNDPQMKLKNNSERIGSIEAHNEQFQIDEPEMNENSNEFWKSAKNYATNEISSGQSLDSSSNSIKNSQERHEEYNTQRYITLYTEEISYKSKTTEKTEIIPIAVITRRPKVKKRPMTTSTPKESHFSSDRTEKIEILRANHDTDDTKLDISNSSHDTESSLTLESKYELRAKQNYEKPRKHGKADESRSKSKQKNVEIISQYDAVINVQLANSELLKSLRKFEPLGIETKYDTTLYPRSAIQIEPVPTKSIISPLSMRAQAEIKPQKPTSSTKSHSRYSKHFYRKQFSDLRKNIAHPSPNEGHPVDQFMKDKNHSQKYLRRSDNDNIRAFNTEDFNTYVIKRINAMENELKELKQMNEFSFRSRMNDNNTYGVTARNVTDKFEVKDKVASKRKDMKVNVIERLLKEDHDLNNEEVNDGHKFTTRNNTMNIESSTIKTKSRKLNVLKKDVVNATVIHNKNITQVTNNTSKINVNGTKKLNKEVINISESTIGLVQVTNLSKLESAVTTPTFVITRRTMAYSEPSYSDALVPTVRNNQFDPFFDHVNDGIDLRM